MLPVRSQYCGLPPVIEYVLFIRIPVLWLVNAEYMSLGHEPINVPYWQIVPEIPLDICASLHVIKQNNVNTSSSLNIYIHDDSNRVIIWTSLLQIRK